LAGDADVALDGSVEPGAPSRARSRWPWHLAVAAVFALGIGSAAMLARGGKVASARPLPAPVPPSPPLVAPPPVAIAPAKIVDESPSTLPGDHIRRTGKSHAARPQPAVQEAAPAAKKSKADDKIAPSPYTAPKAP
jgi:hypothetical protein